MTQANADSTRGSVTPRGAHVLHRREQVGAQNFVGDNATSNAVSARRWRVDKLLTDFGAKQGEHFSIRKETNGYLKTEFVLSANIVAYDVEFAAFVKKEVGADWYVQKLSGVSVPGERFHSVSEILPVTLIIGVWARPVRGEWKRALVKAIGLLGLLVVLAWLVFATQFG